MPPEAAQQPDRLVTLTLRAWRERVRWMADRLTSGCNSTGGKTPIMMRTVAHFLPFAALAGGVLILLMPRLLNYVVAVYLILVGAIGLNNIYHFIR